MPNPADSPESRMLAFVVSGQPPVVRSFLNNGAAVTATDAKGRSGLHLAMERLDDYNDHTREIAAMFLNHGLDINARDNEGATALHYAVRDKTSWRAGYKCNDLLTFGADIEARDLQGRTALHHAVLIPNVDITKFLIARANINAVDDKGYSVLHMAAAGGNATIIRELINAGADLQAKTFDGKTVWEAAVEAGQDYQGQSLKAEAAKALKAAAEKAEAREKAAEADRIARENYVPPKPKDPWSLLDESRIAFSKTERAIGYQLTEIFNFSARTYTQITHNLATKTEAVTFRTFDEFTDRTALEKAHAELERLGGSAEKCRIVGPMVEKLRIPPKLPPNQQ